MTIDTLAALRKDVLETAKNYSLMFGVPTSQKVMYDDASKVPLLINLYSDSIAPVEGIEASLGMRLMVRDTSRHHAVYSGSKDEIHVTLWQGTPMPYPYSQDMNFNENF